MSNDLLGLIYVPHKKQIKSKTCCRQGLYFARFGSSFGISIFIFMEFSGYFTGRSFSALYPGPTATSLSTVRHFQLPSGSSTAQLAHFFPLTYSAASAVTRVSANTININADTTMGSRPSYFVMFFILTSSIIVSIYPSSTTTPYDLITSALNDLL